jgi:hypothetical protein
MSSAIELNAQATLTNGQGLAVNANIAGVVSQYLNLPAVALISNIFSMSTTQANDAPVLGTILETLGTNTTQGKYLLDFYPFDVTPVCSGTVTLYGTSNATASFINTYNTQASLPFSNGMSGFANVVNACKSHTTQSYETSASITMLSNKTYGQSGIGYTGLSDLATNGIGSTGAILAAAVAHFGTMFDVQKINLFADPYVFGQNLLNQGLGQYGNLIVNLEAAGLNTADITQIPATVTNTAQQESFLTKSTAIGEIQLPIIDNVVMTNVVTGSSTDVILNIYSQVTGADLTAIVSATGLTTVGAKFQAKTLADYLDINKVIDISTVNKLAGIGVTSLPKLATYLNTKIGQGTFSSWTQVGTLLSSIEVPTLNYTTTKPGTPILSSSTISTLNSASPVGTGGLGNALLKDYIGACSDPAYVTRLTTILNTYTSVTMSTVESALTQLKSAVSYWVTNISRGIDGDGNPTISYPSTTPISSATTAVISAMNSLPASRLQAGQTAQYQILTALTTEVNNLSAATVIFSADPSPTSTLKNFAQSIGMFLRDKDQVNSYQTLLDLSTHDAAGDTIRALSAEVNNSELLSSVGITVNNDPNPSLAIYQAKAQNVSLTTYLSQNK